MKRDNSFLFGLGIICYYIFAYALEGAVIFFILVKIARNMGDIWTLVLGVPMALLATSLPHKGLDLFLGIGSDRRLTLGERLDLQLVPHFGIMIKGFRDQINEEAFFPYAGHFYKEEPFIYVSESGRWVRIFGHYYPIDLICGYNEQENLLYTIDGDSIKLPRAARRPECSSGITAFFEEKGHYYREAPAFARLTFDSLVEDTDELYKENFSELRYKWDARMAEISNNDYEDIFVRGLSPREINLLYKKVNTVESEIKKYFVFDSYRNEYGVCNGVRLIQKLPGRRKIWGLEFLFDCLGDMEEPYFAMAAQELLELPREEVKKEIEKRAQQYYHERNVLKMTGLMYLAKSFKYKIRYLEEVEESHD